MQELIVTADLGHFKAYKLIKSRKDNVTPRVELLKCFDNLEAHERISEKMSDAAGRFRRAGAGAGYNSAGSGERHNMDTETKKRLIKKMAECIDSMMKGEDCDAWHLAAGSDINNALLRNLSPYAKERLINNIKSDLTKLTKSEIVERFTESE